jgi:hypothetical protein
LTSRAARLLAVVLGALSCAAACDQVPSPLLVTFLEPVNGTGSVPRQPVIYVRFNRPLDPATVIDANFILIDSSSNIIGTAPTYYPCLNEVRIVPDSALNAGATYQMNFMPGIEDTDGVGYVGAFFQFTTTSSLDNDRPTFTDATAGVPTSTTVPLNWSAAVDPFGSGVVYDVFMSPTTGCIDFTLPLMASVSSSTGVTVTGLSTATTYYFVVRARDATGNVSLNSTEIVVTTP